MSVMLNKAWYTSTSSLFWYEKTPPQLTRTPLSAGHDGSNKVKQSNKVQWEQWADERIINPSGLREDMRDVFTRHTNTDIYTAN